MASSIPKTAPDFHFPASDPPNPSSSLQEKIDSASIATIRWIASMQADSPGSLRDRYIAIEDYQGPLRNGLAHGIGKIIFPGGTVYSGNFQEGRPTSWGHWQNKHGVNVLFLDGQPYNGKGHTDYTNQASYIGNFKDGLPDGEGTMTFSDEESGILREYTGIFTEGAFFEGEVIIRYPNRTCKTAFKNGQSIGEGAIAYDDGDVYIGQLDENQQPSGYGKMTSDSERIVYTANFQNGFLHGEVSILYPDRTCKTAYINGEPFGAGTITYHQGNVYMGHLDRDEQPSGYGQMSSDNGRRVDYGYFQNGNLHGKVITRYPDRLCETTFYNGLPIGDSTISYDHGDIYIGQLDIDQQPSGMGRLLAADGERTYRGVFHNGLLHGKVTIDYPDRICETTFENGHPLAVGTIAYRDGRVYKGQLDPNQQPSGIGTLAYRNGRTYHGGFLNGVYHGIGEFYLENGSSFMIRYQLGARSGTGIFRTSDGQSVLSDENFKPYLIEDLKASVDPKFVYKEIRYSDNSFYAGNVNEQGLPNGYGKLSYADGVVCEGCFLNGLLHGLGRKELSPGNFDHGEFRDGMLDGIGCRQFSDGSYEMGEFQKGRNKGIGMQLLAGPTPIFLFGTFEDRLLHGLGTAVYADGSEVTGTFENGAVFGTNESDIGAFRFINQLFGLGQISGLVPGDTTGSVIDFLQNHGYERYTQELTAAHLRLKAADFQAEAENIYLNLEAQKPQLMFYGTQNHSIGLRLVPDGNFIRCQIFNSGNGLYMHPQKGTKFQTMVQIKIPIQNMTREKIQILLDYKEFTTIEDAYKAVIDLKGDGSAQPGALWETPLPGEEIWQRDQKGNNCGLEWVFAYLRHAMPKNEYKEMRMQLFELSAARANENGSVREEHLSTIRTKLNKKRVRLYQMRLRERFNEMGFLVQSPSLHFANDIYTARD